MLQVAGGAMLGLGIYFRVSNDANAIVEIAGVTFYYAGISGQWFLFPIQRKLQ